MPMLLPVAFMAAASFVGGKIISSIMAPAAHPTVPSPVAPAVDPPNPLDVKPALAGPLSGLFGSRRVGGNVIFSYRNGTKTHYVIAIAGAPLSKIVGVYINNVLVNIDTSSNNVTSAPWAYTFSSAGVTTTYYAINVRLYDGTQTAADPVLLASVPNYSANAIGKNIAYAAITVDTNAWTLAQTGNSSQASTAFQNAMPDFTFWCLGHKCYDPRDVSQVLATPSTWKWSGNPSIIEANYRIHQLGMQVPTSLIDWSSVATCATIDETTTATASGANEYKYQCALYWQTDERHEAVCARIAASHDGGMSLIGNLWTCRTGVWTTPVAALTSDDYVKSGLTLSDTVPIQSTANGVRGKFASAGANFEARDFPAYQDATALAQDSTPIWLDLDLQTVASASQAQRLARIAYNRRRFGRLASVVVSPKWLVLTAGDTITLTDALAGISAESFRVLSRALNSDFSVELQLQSESAATYAWTASTDETQAAIYPPVGGLATFLPAPGFVLFDTTPGATVTPAVKILLPPVSDFDTWRVYSHDGSSTASLLAVTQVTLAALSAANGTFGVRVENSYNGRVSQIASFTVPKAAIDAALTTGLSLTIPSLASVGNWALPTPADPYMIGSAAGVAAFRIYATTPETITYIGAVTNQVQSLALIWSTTPDVNAAIAAVAAGGGNVQFLSNTDQTITVTAAPGTVRYYWVVASATGDRLSWTGTVTGGIHPQSAPTNGLAIVF